MKKLALLLTPLLVLSLILGAIGCAGEEEATPTPTLTATPTPTATATPGPGATPTPTPGPGATATPTPTPASTPPPTATPPPSPTPTPEPIVLKVVAAYPETHPVGMAAAKFAELVEEHLAGRVTVDLFLGGVLFSAKAEWEAVLTGAVDISFTPPYYSYMVIPQNYLWYQKGIWYGFDHSRAVLQDERFRRIFKDLAAEKGVKQLGFAPSGGLYSAFILKKEARKYKDLEGRRIASTGVPSPEVKYYGYIHTTISREESYLALAQGIVEGFSTAISGVVDYKLYEVADYVLLYPGGYFVTQIWMNQDSWNSLPADIQDILENKVALGVEAYMDRIVVQDMKDSIEFLRANVKAVHYITPEDEAALLEWMKTAPDVQKRMASYGEEILGIMEELRPTSE